MALEANAKFYIIDESRIRPYLGAGLAYNRANLKYAQTSQSSSSYNYNGNQIGQEEYSAGYVAGSALVGVQVAFTNAVGVQAEFGFTKGLSNASGTSAQNPIFNPDQERLDKIGQSVQDASFYTLGLGLVIAF
jgi:opacity protein-like surface antigen